MKILEELNTPQREAVEYMDGPHMVVAGAGSGKTRVLTYKVAYLMHKGVDPFNILALTFTNKAAREMKERIEHLLGSTEARNVWMGTFHSVFAKVLRIEAEKLGFTQNFTIYDTDDSKSLLKNIIKEYQLDDKVYKPSAVMSRISSAKTNLLSEREYNNNAELLEGDKAAKRPMTGRIFTAYQERLRRANAMDFDDLLFNMNLLLRDFPEILLKYQRKFKYILVDEYQDTNYAQYLIVKKLAAKDENLCVVGDDAQSIYAFRGANIQNFLNLKSDYPDLQMFKLEQNYRSTQNIVNLANSIIDINRDQIKKTVWTDNEEGEKVHLNSLTSDNEEGNYIARTIFDLKNKKQVLENEIVILYRTNAQSRAIEEALRRLNIPYKIFGGMSFYKRKEIKDVLAYFSLVLNPHDEAALMRVINYPKRGIGQTTLDKLQLTANESKRSIWQVLKNLPNENLLPSSTVVKIMEFVNMIEVQRIHLMNLSAYEMAMQIAQTSGIMKELINERSDEEGIMRFENVEELMNSIKDFSEQISDEEGASEIQTLDLFMRDIALYTDADEKGKEDGVFVSLMTIHAAKGLEFGYNFIVGLEENLFPSMMSLGSRAEIEEERRLFYVAVTRGKKQVFLSYANTRYKWGNLQYCEPSRFIAELNPIYVSDFTSGSLLGGMEKPTSSTSSKSSAGLPRLSTPRNLKKIESTLSSTSSTIPSDSAKIQSGMDVMHDRFGKGKVLRLDGEGDNKKAIVFFANFGEKNLLLRFAKLQIL